MYVICQHGEEPAQLYMRKMLGCGSDVPRHWELGEQPSPEEVPEQWTGFLRLEVTVTEHGQQQAGLGWAYR